MALRTKDFSITGKSGSGGIAYTYILRVTENSASLVNNKPVSNVTVEAILKQDYNGLAFKLWTTTVTASINGKQIFSDAKQRELNGTGEHVYYTWTGDVDHNSTENPSITVGGQLWQREPADFSPPTLTIAENSADAMALTPVAVSAVCIFENGYEKYASYIYDGEKFVKCVPYIHNGSEWQRY